LPKRRRATSSTRCTTWGLPSTSRESTVRRPILSGGPFLYVVKTQYY